MTTVAPMHGDKSERMTQDDNTQPRRRRRQETENEGETRGMALVPQRERTVDFYGDDIPVAQTEDGTLYVALRPVTDFLGLDFSSQRHRVMRDEVMAERSTSVLMTAADGRQRAQLCLPLDLLPGWLFGVSPRQARPEIMEKLTRYRADCFRVLWHAFAGEASSVVSATAVVPSPHPDRMALEHIEHMALAIARMAHEQRTFEQRVDTHFVALQHAIVEQREEVMGRLDQAAAVVGSLLHRMNAVEGLVAPGQVISDAQAAEISTLVKAMATEMTARDKGTGATGRNPYQAVFGELYRRFRVSSYHTIPLRRFGEVMAWLKEYQETMDAHGAS
jgi:hypothetical protein